MTNCPVCKQAATRDVLTLKAIPVLCNSLAQTAQAGRAAPVADLALCLCETCGHLFNRAFDAALLAYDGAYDTTLGHSATFRAYVDGLARHLVGAHGLAVRRVLEMGCGQGDFLGRLLDAGVGEAVGYDPSYRGEAHPRPGLTIHATTFDAGDAGAQADLACSRHVLEHLEDPEAGLHGMLAALCDTRLTVRKPDPGRPAAFARRETVINAA